MDTFLYFATAGGADAAADNIVVPASELLSINATAATTCNIYFKNPRILEGTDADSTKNYVELTYTSGSFKVVAEAIVNAAAGAFGKGMVVICDMNNNISIDPSISACIVSTADDNTNPDD